MNGEVSEFRNSGFGVLLFVSPWAAEEVKGSLLMTFTIGASYVTQTMETNPTIKDFSHFYKKVSTQNSNFLANGPNDLK